MTPGRRAVAEERAELRRGALKGVRFKDCTASQGQWVRGVGCLPNKQREATPPPARTSRATQKRQAPPLRDEQFWRGIHAQVVKLGSDRIVDKWVHDRAQEWNEYRTWFMRVMEAKHRGKNPVGEYRRPPDYLTYAWPHAGLRLVRELEAWYGVPQQAPPHTRLVHRRPRCAPDRACPRRRSTGDSCMIRTAHAPVETRACPQELEKNPIPGMRRPSEMRHRRSEERSALANPVHTSEEEVRWRKAFGI